MPPGTRIMYVNNQNQQQFNSAARANTVKIPVIKTGLTVQPSSNVVYNRTVGQDIRDNSAAVRQPAVTITRAEAPQQQQHSVVVRQPAVTITPIEAPQQRVHSTYRPVLEEISPPSYRKGLYRSRDSSRNYYDQQENIPPVQYQTERSETGRIPHISESHFAEERSRDWQEFRQWQQERPEFSQPKSPYAAVRSEDKNRDRMWNSNVMAVPEPKFSAQQDYVGTSDSLHAYPMVGAPEERTYSGPPKKVEMPNFVNETSARLYNRRMEETTKVQRFFFSFNKICYII